MNADHGESSGVTGCRPAVPSDLLEALAGLRRPVVVGHVLPDADCLGSMLAVAGAWPGDHGRCAAVCLPAGTVSRRLEFMVDWAGVRVVDASGLAAADGLVVVDTATPERGNVAEAVSPDWFTGRPVVNIDHHQTNTRFGTVNWVVDEASSAAELVYDVIRAAGRPLTATAASLLFAGLHADTRGFTIDGVRARSLAVAAELVEAGARVGEIGERLYRSRSRCEFELLKLIYANTRSVAEGRIALSTADHGEIAAC
ncbi:MAG: DHH family phosphoesterase, partial [Planctomycetes bacterium]|nr:DHH family phosphoesterase [Planctomycetota bacterium]